MLQLGSVCLIRKADNIVAVIDKTDLIFLAVTEFLDGADKLPKEKMGLKTMWPIACGMLHNSTLKRILLFGIAIKRGGASLQDRMDKEKKPYIFVGLVCVREQYQGQGYMRKVLELAFAEGDRLGLPVILETDAKSKCDKYVHLGMELAETHDLGAFGKLYDLIRYPRHE